jgi:hypothetical protein
VSWWVCYYLIDYEGRVVHAGAQRSFLPKRSNLVPFCVFLRLAFFGEEKFFLPFSFISLQLLNILQNINSNNFLRFAHTYHLSEIFFTASYTVIMIAPPGMTMASRMLRPRKHAFKPPRLYSSTTEPHDGSLLQSCKWWS